MKRSVREIDALQDIYTLLHFPTLARRATPHYKLDHPR
jgi:hypothetical protein